MGARGPIGLGLRFALVALGCAGCNTLLGIDDGILDEDRCEPLSVTACYSGPPETEGVGACQTGLMRCNAAGDGYGPCQGEVTPAPERCGNAADDDCDGAIDEADGDGGRPEDPADSGGAVCACAPDTVEPCPYGGPPGTVGVGVCSAGWRTCGSDGRWGACAGEITPRIEDCATPADEDCNGGWDCGAVLPGGPLGGLLGGAGRERATALAAGPEGSAILGGEFEGTLDLGAGPLATVAEQDIFVARLEPDGTVKWTTPRLIDEGRGSLQALAVDRHGGVAITGELVGVMSAVGLPENAPVGFVIKLDAEGVPRWGKKVPGRPQDIAISAAGEIVVVSTQMEPSGTDVAVTRFSAAGDPLEGWEFGGTGIQEPTGVAVDPRGDVLITGTFHDELQLGPSAPRLSSPENNGDVFLAKFDEGGRIIGSMTFGDGRRQQGGDVEIGPAGEIALSGTFEGLLGLDDSMPPSEGMSAFVIELGPAREHRFSLAYPAELPPRVAIEADGGLVLTGDVDGPTDLGGGPLVGAGSRDVVVARFDAGGRHVWSKRLGPGAGSSGGRRSAAGIATFADRGNVLLAGTVEGSVNLDGATAQSTAADILLVRMAH
ncbi:hypothetical protein WME90_29495 [Sorangium sp. So ce375]|uniref:hypothetical protein n=1 Tax=Sorangium sp. So ce375 TaxID=3133306 RepID=UPI003F5C61B1